MADLGPYSYSIRSTDADWQDRLQPAALFSFMQEAAYLNAEALRLGASSLDSRDLCWIMARVSARFLFLPRWGEKMTIDTWHRGVQRLIFTRDFEFYDKSGTRFGYATSDWLVADRQTHRPQKPDDVFPGCQTLAGGRSVFPAGEAPARLQPFDADQRILPWHTVQADFCDIDRNGHVNNTRYVAWCLNAIYTRLAGFDAASGERPGRRMDELPLRPISGIDISYVKEVLLGTRIDCFGQQDPAGMCCLLDARDVADGSPVFRARILLKA